jgi:hypothetical protein
MATPKNNSKTKAKSTAAKKLNPYEGYRVSALLRRNPRFSHRGTHYNVRKLTAKQLELLANDKAFAEISKTKSD